MAIKDNQEELIIKVKADLLEADKNDTETAHFKADEALCDFLTALGFEDVVAIYNKINKWYA